MKLFKYEWQMQLETSIPIITKNSYCLMEVTLDISEISEATNSRVQQI